MQALDLSIYDAISSSQWREWIEKELKDLSWDDLSWHPEEGLTLQAAYHPDDQVPAHFLPNILQGDWLIGESFQASENPGTVNAALLDALNFGLASPLLRLHSTKPSEQLLRDVYSNYLYIRWETEEPEHFEKIREIQAAAAEENAAYQASVHFTHCSWQQCFQLRSEWAKASWFSEERRQWRWFHIAGKNTSVGAQVADIVTQIRDILEHAHVNGLDIRQVAGEIQVLYKLGDALLLEAAALRAIRLCYLNICKHLGVDSAPPLFIDVHCDEQKYSADENYNRIKASLMGWAAAVGGADCITLLPGVRSEQGFDKRIARNVQHLLKMESYLGRVADPLSGAYYIEAATSQLAEKAWKALQHNL